MMRSRFVTNSDLANVFLAYAQQVTFTVIGGWMVLALGGRWRSEPSWIDRTGRVTGIVWIAVTAVHWSKYFLF